MEKRKLHRHRSVHVSDAAFSLGHEHVGCGFAVLVHRGRVVVKQPAEYLSVDEAFEVKEAERASCFGGRSPWQRCLPGWACLAYTCAWIVCSDSMLGRLSLDDVSLRGWSEMHNGTDLRHDGLFGLSVELVMVR